MFPITFALEWEYRELKPQLGSVINVLRSQCYLWFLRIISTSIRWNSQHRTCDGFLSFPMRYPLCFFFLIGKRFSFFDWDLIFLNIVCHVLREKMVPWKNFCFSSLKWIASLTLGFSPVKRKVQSNRLTHLPTLYPSLPKDYIFQPFGLSLGRWHVLVNERWVEVVWTSSRQKLYKEFTNCSQF